MFIKKYPLLTAVIIVLVGGGIWYRQLVINVAKPVIVAASSSQATPTSAPVEDNTFRYPSLGISTPLTTLTNTDPFDSTDWSRFTDALNAGVGVSTASATIDESHTLYIVGHSSTVKQTPYSFVFAGLGQANLGDTFSFTADNKTYTYKVTDKRVLKPTDIDAFKALETPGTSPKQAILVTCWPVFTTKNRMVIVGELQ